MLLTNKNTTIIEIDGIKVELKITFKVLENAYNLLQDRFIKRMLELVANSPFDLIEKLEQNNSIIALIYCMANGKLPVEVIKKVINKFEKEEMQMFKQILNAAVISSMVYIDDNTKDNENQNQEENKENKFDEYYNYLYLSAITQLGYTKNQFYNLTPSELKQLLNNNLIHRKAALLHAYIDVMQARNDSNKDTDKKKNDTITAKDANEFFDLI